MDPRIQVAIDLMRSSFHRDGSFDQAACSVNLSPSRLRHLFTLETGISPTHYLRTLRIEEARVLLETTWLTVAQIVLKVGLQDRSHFERQFKSLHGMTPVQHRMRFRFTLLATEIQ
jgi:transcriptional regulator GlxA family with amidase domain